MQLLKTTNTDTRFIALCSELDADLKKQNGQQMQALYKKYNTLERIKHVVLALQNEAPVACAALKEYAPDTAEVKRVFTKPHCRGQGLAVAVMATLEQLAKQQGYTRLVLETGLNMLPAQRLYHRLGFHQIQNYGQYATLPDSYCMEKAL